MPTLIPSRARLCALGLAMAGSALLLSGCIAAPVTASGSGVVTISWASELREGAAAFDGAFGDVLELCAESAPGCGPGFPGTTIFRYFPTEGSMSATLSSATPMTDAGGATTLPPPGTYTLQAVAYSSGTPGGSPVGDLLSIVLGPPATKDLTTWLQSLARSSQEADCPRGYTPSWDSWPGDGAGGYVCNRMVYAYYPDESVPVQGVDATRPEWLWSVERSGPKAPCPQGFDPSWAQWPGKGAGGYVCNAVSH